MNLLRACALLVCALPATAQQVDELVRIVPLSQGMLRSDEVFLRNATTVDLSVWLSVNDGDWREYSVPQGTGASIRADAVRFAIATLVQDGDGSEGAPPVDPRAIKTGARSDGSWFYRMVSGSKRPQLCWAQAARRWRIAVDDNICS